MLEKIDGLNKAMEREYARLAKRYGFSLRGRRVIFLKNIRKRNRQFRISSWRYIIPKNIRHVLSLPFIYSMIIPAVILDIFLTLYHHVAFSLYHIPKVRRRDYIVFDRRFLDYLRV
jgi:hypothetical protein